MKVFRGFNEAGKFTVPVVTTGSFDGVHTGHKAIINRLKNLATRYNGETVLITYYPHPRKVLYPDTEGKNLRLITTMEERLFLLEKEGVDNVVVVNFTPEFAKTTCEDYVKNYLVEKIGAKIIVVGFNHYFGWHRQGDFNYLKELGKKYGFEAEEIPEKEIEHETVSSTRIRKALSEGYIQRANAYLDNFYLIMAPVKEEKNPAATGYSFFRIILNTEEDKLIPPPGVYAVSVEKETVKSKGLGLIYQSESGGDTVLFHPFEKIVQDNQKIRLCFHKQITAEINLNDTRALKTSLEIYTRAIKELIY